MFETALVMTLANWFFYIYVRTCYLRWYEDLVGWFEWCLAMTIYYSVGLVTWWLSINRFLVELSATVAKNANIYHLFFCIL